MRNEDYKHFWSTEIWTNPVTTHCTGFGSNEELSTDEVHDRIMTQWRFPALVIVKKLW
jgi:hypothetical protein